MRAKMSLIGRPIIVSVIVLGLHGSRLVEAEGIDLSRAVVVVPGGLSGPEAKAARLLVEEVQSRARIRWDVKIHWPEGAVPVVAVGPFRLLDAFAGPYKPKITSPPAGSGKDGFQIRTFMGETGAHGGSRCRQRFPGRALRSGTVAS